jgi:vancomycin aglycone glucosyltransferase
MQVVLTTWGARGDLEPMAALALALRELDVEVTMCAPGDDEFVELFDHIGVPLVPTGPTVHSIVAAAKPTADRAFTLAPELVTARVTTLMRQAADADAIVATGLMPAGARDVADKLGTHYVLACFHLSGLPSQHYRPGRRPGTPSSEDETDLRVLWKEDAERVNGLYLEAVNTNRANLGLPLLDNVRDYVLTDHPWLAADPTLCPSEGMTELDVVQTGAWIRPDDRPLPASLEAFLAAGPPPVYVGLGSTGAHAPKDTASAAIEAARAHGRRVVLSSGWAELAAIDDADDCYVTGEVNHQALFPRTAAVIHHGGAGTTTTAARAGVPQVIIPLIADQPFWATRVTTLGIGTAHPGLPTYESLSAALDISLAEGTQQRARALAPTIRTNGAQLAAQQLVDRMTQ